ncbi:MAG: hypothetical protein EOL88_10815 [Bacteroidia bacterium]|nr:hypothetical protein [Bacteroidia bacterium]
MKFNKEELCVLGRKAYEYVKIYARLIQKHVSPLWEPYRSVGNTFRDYFTIYGGFKALCSSPYMHIAVIIGIVVSILQHGTKDSSVAKCAELVLGVIPDLIGFTIGGYAIFLAFGDDDFRQEISGDAASKKHENHEFSSGTSPFMVFSASFIHFIVVSIISVIFAIITKHLNCDYFVLYFLCSTIFVYAVLCALAVAFAIFKISRYYDTYSSIKKSIPKDNKL